MARLRIGGDEAKNMTLRPDSIVFGALSAERDMKEGLAEYFVQSPSFRRISNWRKFVLLGNRGVGKTAIFKMIAERERKAQSIVVELSPEDYSYELLAQIIQAESAGGWSKQGAYAAAWKYLLWLLSMKQLTNADGGLKKGGAKRIYNYLRDSHAGVDTNPVGHLISYLKRLEKITIGKYGAEIKARELHSLYKLEELEPFLADLDLLAQEKGLTILVDELDRGWDGSEHAKAFVAGLFQAATSISARTPHIRVLISLRRELYQNIPSLYEDAQKVRDVIEELYWTDEDLLEVIARRVRFASSEFSHLSSREVWNSLFDSNSIGESSFEYVIARTSRRPRELIQFCNLIRDRAVEHNAKLPFAFTAILQAEKLYSRERIEDIAAENKFEYPGLLTVFETFRGSPELITSDNLQYHLLRIIENDIHVGDKASWCRELNPDHFVKILWSVGFIRASIQESENTQRLWVPSHHDAPNLNLGNVKLFDIHPMFRSFLNVRASDDSLSSE